MFVRKNIIQKSRKNRREKRKKERKEREEEKGETRKGERRRREKERLKAYKYTYQGIQVKNPPLFQIWDKQGGILI